MTTTGQVDETMLAARVQTYLRASAAHQYEAVPALPFTCFFNCHTDFPYFNYAIPEPAAAADYAAGLDALLAAFHAHQRMPRLEFVEVCAPALAGVLTAAGFELEARHALMVCTPADLRMPSLPAGLAIRRLTPDATDEELVRFRQVQALGFGAESLTQPSPEEIAEFRAELARAGVYWAWLAETPVAAAQFSPLQDGLTELGGVATLMAYRGQGIGRALSAAAVHSAFDAGAELVCLSAADAAAERVYQAIGFRGIGAVLDFRLPASASSTARIQSSVSP